MCRGQSGKDMVRDDDVLDYCPFCAYDADVVIEETFENNKVTGYKTYVKCNGCAAIGPWRWHCVDFTEKHSMDSASRAWNRRALNESQNRIRKQF